METRHAERARSGRMGPLERILTASWAAQVLDVSDAPMLLLGTSTSGYAPLWSNVAFEQMTGYRADELSQTGLWSLLDPADTSASLALQAAVDDAAPAEVRSSVQTREGRSIGCSVIVLPLCHESGPIAGFSVRLEQVPPGVELAESLATVEIALAAAEAALADAETAKGRAALLAEATSELAISLDVAGSLQRLAHLAVPDLADWVVIDLAHEEYRSVQVAMLHREGMPDVLQRFRELQPSIMTDDAPVMRILRGEPPILVPNAGTQAATSDSDPELSELCDILGICSAMYVPLTARNRVLGCIALFSGSSGRIFDSEDLDFAVALGRRAALVVDNASIYEREHRIAQVLQESLLPRLPEVPGLELAASYLPSNQVAAVGGDFYDVLVLPDGSMALAVGDIVGHDLDAAAAMGQLRSLFRACVWEMAADGQGDVGSVLVRLDRLVQALQLTALATLFCARVARSGPPGAPWTVSHAAAGHPAPLVRDPGGQVYELAGAHGLVLGVAKDGARCAETTLVHPGSLLVAYTDGLVERRGEDWDDGVERVRRLLADAPGDITPTDLAELLAEAGAGERHDDIAILVVRFS